MKTIPYICDMQNTKHMEPLTKGNFINWLIAAKVERNHESDIESYLVYTDYGDNLIEVFVDVPTKSGSTWAMDSPIELTQEQVSLVYDKVETFMEPDVIDMGPTFEEDNALTVISTL